MDAKKMKKSKITPKSNKVSKTGTIKTKKPKKLKKSIAAMSADDFMSGGFEDVPIDDDSASSDDEQIVPKKTKKVLKEKKSKKLTNGAENGPEGSDDDSESGMGNFKAHKKDLDKLKDTDPEFYKFLEENDQELLNFDDVSDDENDDEEDSLHRPPEELEVASDESDFEPDDATKVSRKSGQVTLKTIEGWREALHKDKSTKTLREVLEAFEAALQCVVAESERIPCKYQVEGAAVFNAVVRLCVIEVQPALRLVLDLPANNKQSLTKAKKWNKVKNMVRQYLLNLTRLCQVTSAGMLTVLLKHVHQMVPYAVCFPNIASRLLSRLVGLWIHDADVVRVLAFLCLLRIANVKRILLSHILKKMYIAFVRNSKFVSPNTLTGINFLRQSLAEMFALDPNLSYQHCFLYIRQLSIHLRNAVTLKKKESYQAVYNWQYIQSLHLWATVLSLTPKSSPLSGLIYPLVQITLGTIKLIPSAQYYPLRFHCVKFLLGLMEKQDVFIPVLPFLLEVLKDYDFNRKHTKVSMKPLDLSCVLRSSKLQMQENGWKDAVIEWLSALLLEAFTIESHRVSFPDVIVPAVIQMKKFLKASKVSKYSRQIKTVLDKAQENAKMVELERSKGNIRLDDMRSISAVEASIRSKGTPLAKYYAQWKKIHDQVEAKKAADTDSIGDFKLPTLYKFSKKESRDREKVEGPVELFPSDDDSDNDMPAALLDADDDDDDDDDEEHQKKKSQKRKSEDLEMKKKTKKKAKIGEDEKERPINLPEDWPDLDTKDIVQDMNLADFE